MKQFKLLSLALVMALCGCSAEKSSEQPAQLSTASAWESAAEEIKVTDYSSLLECDYYDENMFHIYINRTKEYETDNEILCGVAPHHLTAGHMIAGLYEAAAESRDDVETVVICAPLHYTEMGKTCTAGKGWNTPFGILENDVELTEMLVSQLGAETNNDLMEYDHAISSHIPFIKYYFPEAKTACLLISPQEKEDFPERLTETLYKMSETKSCLFVFSIDFSHYLAPIETEEKDKETLEAVLSEDLTAIEAMNNDNVDTPYGLSTFVRLSEKLGGKITCADNSHTQKITGLPYNESNYPEGMTSYFVFFTN